MNSSDINSSDIELASHIASRFFRQPVRELIPVVGRGSVNKIFVAKTEDSEAVLRMRDEAGAFDEYQKEAWCLAQASARGIPGPCVLSIGRSGTTTAYTIQTLVRGMNGDESGADGNRIWRELGGYAKLIHSIKAVGYGSHLVDAEHGRFQEPGHDGFDGSWTAYIEYNIESLSERDELRRIEVLTVAESEKIKRLFEELRDRQFSFGLTHGDIALRNTIVDGSGKVWLLDWGSAGVDLVPHADLIQMLKCQLESDDPTSASVRAFLDGYGISEREFKALEPLLDTLLLLRAIDKLRWAIDRCPSQIQSFAAHARRAVEKKLSRPVG